MGVIRKREDLAREIKAACARKGLSLAGLGRELGASAPSINRAVNRNDISISTLRAYADALACDLVIALIPKPDDPGSGPASERSQDNQPTNTVGK